MNFDGIINELLKTDGAMAAAVVDYSSGMLLAGAGTSSMDLEIAAAGNTEVVRAKMKTMKLLNLKDSIDDILITLGGQYHLIRPIAKMDGLFLYFVLAKDKSNLALARRALTEAEKNIYAPLITESYAFLPNIHSFLCIFKPAQPLPSLIWQSHHRKTCRHSQHAFRMSVQPLLQ